MTKLLVLSDSHGGRTAIERVLMKESKSIDALIFLGDGLRDLELALTLYPKLRAYSVAGNCDYGALEPTDGLAAFDGVVIFYTHGHMYGVKYDLDTLAERLLAAYYPEALEKPRRVDAHEMAERMGLSVLYRQIEPEGEIYGEMFFQETETPLYDAMRQHQVLAPVERKTMVVDTTATFMGGMARTTTRSCTNVCTGRYMDRRWRWAGPNNRTAGTGDLLPGGRRRWARGDDRLLEMEWQANTLARCIQMPRALFRRKAEEAGRATI